MRPRLGGRLLSSLLLSSSPVQGEAHSCEQQSKTCLGTLPVRLGSASLGLEPCVAYA